MSAGFSARDCTLFFDDKQIAFKNIDINIKPSLDEFEGDISSKVSGSMQLPITASAARNMKYLLGIAGPRWRQIAREKRKMNKRKVIAELPGITFIKRRRRKGPLVFMNYGEFCEGGFDDD